MKLLNNYKFAFYLFSIFLLPNISSANDYSMNNILIESYSTSATEARNQAIEEGQKKALLLFAEKTAPFLINYITGLTSDQISNFIQDIQLTNEKISTTSYSADLNVTFNEMNIQSLLTQNSLHQIKPNSTLIIPIYMSNNITYMWEEKNIFLAIWNKLIAENNGNFIIPIGDLEDLSILNDNIISSNEFPKFQSALTRYSCNDLIIVVADYQKNEGDSELIITLKDFTSTNRNITTYSFPITTEDKLETSLTEVAKKILNGTPLKPTVEMSRSYILKAPIKGFDNWLELRNILMHSNLVKKTIVQEISLNSVIVKISYQGTSNEIINFLKNQGFIVELLK